MSRPTINTYLHPTFRWLQTTATNTLIAHLLKVDPNLASSTTPHLVTKLVTEPVNIYIVKFTTLMHNSWSQKVLNAKIL